MSDVQVTLTKSEVLAILEELDFSDEEQANIVRKLGLALAQVNEDARQVYKPIWNNWSYTPYGGSRRSNLGNYSSASPGTAFPSQTKLCGACWKPVDQCQEVSA